MYFFLYACGAERDVPSCSKVVASSHADAWLGREGGGCVVTGHDHGHGPQRESENGGASGMLWWGAGECLLQETASRCVSFKLAKAPQYLPSLGCSTPRTTPPPNEEKTSLERLEVYRTLVTFFFFFLTFDPHQARSSRLGSSGSSEPRRKTHFWVNFAHKWPVSRPCSPCLSDLL